MKPLFQLVADYRHLQEIDPEEIDEQALADTLEGLSGEITIKATNVAYLARNLESFADTVDEAIEAMKKRSEVIRRKADGIRSYLFNSMRGAGITRIQAPEFTISICKNPEAVKIAADAKIPAEYMVKPEPPEPYADKKKLKDALKAGTVIDGVHLEQGLRLSIK